MNLKYKIKSTEEVFGSSHYIKNLEGSLKGVYQESDFSENNKQRCEKIPSKLGIRDSLPSNLISILYNSESEYENIKEMLHEKDSMGRVKLIDISEMPDFDKKSREYEKNQSLFKNSRNNPQKIYNFFKKLKDKYGLTKNEQSFLTLSMLKLYKEKE